MARKKLPSRGWLVALVLALAAAAALATSLYRVRDGELVVERGRDGSPVATRREGWHLKAPFTGEIRRLPTVPIGLSGEVELAGVSGAIRLTVSGRFAVEPDEAEAWIAAAGWRPFVDGVWQVLGERLAAAGGSEAGELFRPGVAERFAEHGRRVLDEAGLSVTAFAVRILPEKNAAAAAAVRQEVGRLARPTGRKVLLVGWDGADWLMIRPLLDAGRLPHLAALVAGGRSGELRSQPPLLSPLVWTTVATGKAVPEHGIADFLVRDPATGGLVPISSASRKVHALWTLLPAFGMTSDVVAWWATWPAEPIAGTMVSDRVAYQLFEYRGDDSAGGKVFPPEAWNGVRRTLVPAEDVTLEEVRRFVDVDREEFERRWRSLPPERRQEDEVNHLRKILATTGSYHRIALSLLDDQADLTMVYYEATDTVGHRFARFLPPAMPGVTGEEVRRFGGALPELYAYADELLGEIVARAGDDTVVLLVSDHGFFTGEARPASDPSDFAQGAPQWHRLHGVIVAAGPGLAPGTIENATIFDVAPTVLDLLGLPVPADMSGRPLFAAADRTLGQLASYEVLPRSAAQAGRLDSAADEQRLRELMALGYVSASAVEDRGPAASASPAAGADLEAVSTEAYNLGRIYQRQGNLEGAREQYELALERLPSFGLGYASLAQVEALEGRHADAYRTLVKGFSKSRTLPMAAVTGLVDEAAKSGLLADAAQVLERLRLAYEAKSAYHAAWGLLREAAGELDAALAHHRRALEIDPLDQLSTEQTVALLRRLGREAEAKSFLESSFEKARGKVTAMNQLAVVALRQGWAPEAEKLLRRVLASDPGNPGVLANLAACLAQQGKTVEALQAMSSAVERDPDNARNHFNLGAMLAGQGRVGEAAEAFDTAIAKGLRSPRVYVAAAKMRFRLGDVAAAEENLEKALAIEPGDQEAQELLAILRQAPP